jgi:hypothetical protein
MGVDKSLSKITIYLLLTFLTTCFETMKYGFNYLC